MSDSSASSRFLVASHLVAGLAFLIAGLAASMVAAQDAGDVLQKERMIADRFMQVLIKRPRPGTALDRVYGFHVRNDSLDELIESLRVADDADDSGAKAMILGLVQLQRGQPALAAKAFALAESRLPEDAASSYYLGRAHLAVGQIEQAAAAMERAIDRGPSRTEALPMFTELGRIYGRAGLNEKALNVWTRLEAMFPGDARVGGQIARTLAEEGNVEEALNRYEKLAKTSRQEEAKIAFAVQAAEMKRRLGKADEATDDLEAILGKLRPGSWLYTDVRNRIEEGFLKSGDYDALADYYQTRLENDEDNLPLRTRLGRILVSAGRLDEAQQTLQSAAERAPDDADVRLALIDVLLNKGDVAAAAKNFEALAERDPQNPDYLLRWGQILLDDQQRELADRRDDAADVWRRLADARQDDAVTLAQVADRMRSIDRKDDAVALYRKAVDVDPTSPQYREYLGEYLHELDRKEEAIEVWKSIAEGDRRDRDSLVRLAEVFATFEFPDRSVAAWRDAATFDLTFAQELRYAAVLREAKQFDQALTRLDAAEAIAETPDERAQLLRDRIETYGQAGTLAEQIAQLKQQPESADQLRQLAMMHQAAGQLTDAAKAIQSATELAPDSVPVLVVAADIAERQNRFADAADRFQRLASIDTRFQGNYLKRVANLQMRLGQVDDALATCEDLIDANPASTESYQFYARTALSVGREEQAVEVLRRAMNVARRDNGPRNMLAATFADRYRTDEAIDLYWQALDFERKTQQRLSVIRRLAPLYDRKGEIDELIQRIEEIGREDNDVRTTQLMISAAYEAVDDYGAARQAIDRLLARQPRDVTLLEEMVRLSDLASELELAAEFQQRVTALADTPENRFKLVQLQLDAGLIDASTALSERISLTSDPQRLGRMIRSAAARGDAKTAVAICEQALRKDDSLWDVKLYLAQLLLYEDGEDAEQAYQRALKLTDDVRAKKLDFDAKPPTAKPVTNNRSFNSNLPADYLTSPQYWSRYDYTLARNYRLGRYGNSAYSYGISYGSGLNLVEPVSFGHARVLATSLKFIEAARGKSGDELDATLAELVENELEMPPADQINDVTLIWEYRALKSLESRISEPSNDDEPNEEEKERTERLNWRLAELDPRNGSQTITSMMMPRVQQARKEKASTESEDSDEKNKEDEEPLEPLSDEKLELLVTLYEDVKTRQQGNPKSNFSRQLLTYQSILNTEFQLAGQPELAKQFEPRAPSDDASFNELLSAINFFMSMGQPDRADRLVDRLLPAVRTDTGVSKRQPTGNSITGSLGGIAQSNDEASKEFLERHRVKLLDALIANHVNTARQSRSRSSRSSLSDGTVQTYYRRGSSSGYSSIQLKAPLSTDLMNQSIVNELSGLCPPVASNSNTRNTTLIVPEEIRGHLKEPLPGAPPHELKTRRVLAAFAEWWADRPEVCFEALVELCNDYPDDVDLQIERARLANELGQTRTALEALDSFDPLDSNMLVRKEMAAMNLAAQLGDLDRARQAAERLFGMRMDSNTQLALADQLQRLGMKDKSTAVLRRMRGGKAQSENTEMQIANAFIAAGEKEAAAEVAYALLRKLGSGRSSNNVDYYRRQAVSILESAGRLDSLIERAERRVKSAPKSIRARSELAELYTAAGRSDDANKLWEEVAEDRPSDPRQLMARATAMVKADKPKEAMHMYLDAFEKQPNLFNSSYYELTRAASAAKAEDEMFERLTEFNPDSLPYFRIDGLLRVGDRDKYSEAKRKFLVHALKGQQIRQNFLARIMRSIPESEIKKIPEIRKIVVESVCDAAAFDPTSNAWNVSSYSSNGIANGSLEHILEVLRSDDEAREKFVRAASKALEKEEQEPTAQFMLAMLDVNDSDKRDEAIDSIRKIVSIEDEDDDEVDEGSDSATESSHKVSGGLLWQAGQILEKTSGIENRPELLVDVYKTATRDPSATRQSQLTFSVGYRLIQAYREAGRPNEARQYLMDTYDGIDNSEQNRFNPGYGDYQDLNAWKSIADALVDVGCPIDAIAIYHRGLAEPAKFELAKRWGGSRDTAQTFKAAAEAAAEKVTPKTAQQHLSRVADAIAAEEQTPAIRLLDLPLSMVASGDLQTGIALAIVTAAETDEGKVALEEFFGRLNELADSKPDDWSIPATRLMIATKLDTSLLPEIAQSLKKRLPKADDIAASRGTPTAVKHRGLLDLYTPTAFLMNADDETASAVGKDLAEYVKTVATAIGDPDAQLAITSLSGASDGSLAGFIDAIEAAIEPGATLSKTQFDTSMRVAKSAASSGDIALSARALKLALENGPPLRQLGADGGDAFAINRRTTNLFGSNQQDDGMSQITGSVLEVIDIWSKKAEVELIETSGDAGPTDEVAERETEAIPADEALPLIVEALQAITMPESRLDSVFPYAKAIASPSNYDRFSSSQKIEARSASVALARAAAAAGQSDHLIASIRDRLKTATDRTGVAALLMDAALAAGDRKTLTTALDAFDESLGQSLPAESMVSKKFDANRSINSQQQQDSFRKSQVINQVLHAAWPIAEYEEELSDEVVAKANELLGRAVTLINSDSYTSRRHHQIARRIQQRSLTRAAERDDRRHFAKMLSSMINGIEAQYANYPEDRRAGYIKRQMESLLNELAGDGQIGFTDRFIRQLIQEEQEAGHDDKSLTPAATCMEIAKLPKDEQFNLLMKITFGETDDAPVLHWGSLVRYDVPPPMVQLQTPRLNEAQNLPTCTPNFPMADTILMLADLAAELKRSDEVAQRLTARSQTAGDDADIAAALVKLAGDRSDASAVLETLEPTLQAVKTRLAENRPDKNDEKLEFPALEAYLVTRALHSGLSNAVAGPLLQDLKTYAIRGQRHMMVSAIGRVRAVNGIGRAAGATETSPLEHFTPVALPSRYNPDTDNLAPLYAINEEGWLSGTSGYAVSQLTLRYPVTGSFTVSAKIKDGGWGESDLSYGGILYEAAGWDQKAKITPLVSGATVEFPVPSIQQGKANEEALRITPEQTVAMVNGEDYATDITAGSFPWVGVVNRMYRTTQVRDIKINGDPVIPREVDLIHPTMRGWAILGSGRGGPDPLLPIGPEQDADEITEQRRTAAENLQESLPEASWSVKDAELHYRSSSTNSYDPASHLQYLRPLLDGDRVEFSFWWKTGETEFQPTLDLLALQLDDDGTRPFWMNGGNDLARMGFIGANQTDELADRIATDTVPKEEAWNTLSLYRRAGTIEVSLNGNPLCEVPATDNTRFGTVRPPDRDVRIRSIKLTGDWPEQLPADLMGRARE